MFERDGSLSFLSSEEGPTRVGRGMAGLCVAPDTPMVIPTSLKILTLFPKRGGKAISTLSFNAENSARGKPLTFSSFGISA